MRFNKLHYNKIFVLIVAVVFAWLLFFTPALVNLWCLVTGRRFFIPDKSSIFSFHVIEMNQGSGEWWLYAKDSRYFYAYGRDGLLYIAFPKSQIAQCPSFQLRDRSTWCEEFQLLQESL